MCSILFHDLVDTYKSSHTPHYSPFVNLCFGPVLNRPKLAQALDQNDCFFFFNPKLHF
jgi:hypothetical protein